MFLAVTAVVALAVGTRVATGIDNPIAHAITPSAGGSFDSTSKSGYIPTGESVELTDTTLPAIANTDPELLEAAEAAATAAEREQGIHLVVTSGWRTASYQQWLLDQAVSRYGDRSEAERRVATPETSQHVKGEALDFGPFDGTLWMQANASRFGLCQIYSNELWHYELASRYGGSCPKLRENAAS